MKFSRTIKVAACLAVFGAAAVVQPAFAGGVTITGDGSSFAKPLIDSCKVAWQSASGNTLGSYPGGGSGTGRKNADAGIGDFNFSDATYTPAKSSIVHIPVVAAPIAIAYNLGTLTQKQLYLSQKTLSDIFAGNITMWNDPAITADNNGPATKIIYKLDADGNPVKDASGKPVVLNTYKVTRHFTLPAVRINIVVRSDSSGTTQNLVHFFKTQFPDTWTKAENSTFSNNFPGNINGTGNLGRIQSAKGSSLVAAQVKRTRYSIGYMEASYATKNGLGVAAIQNKAGNFQGPDAAGTAAFLSAATASADGKLTFDYNTADSGAYVLGIVSYALVDSGATGDKAKAAKSFLQYILDPKCPTTDATLGYTTITGNLLAIDNKLIASLKA